jgi:serine/threonine-protein kinase
MKIIADEARPVTELRKSVPPNVASAVAKSLAKLPADRFDSAKAFAEALSNPAFTSVTVGTTPTPTVLPSSRLTVLFAALTVLSFAFALWGWLRPAPAPAVARYGLAFPPGQELLDVSYRTFALAPDGSWIVYDGPAESGNQLWIKRRDAYEATPVAGTAHDGASAPAVSPDGEWIVFTTGGQLRKVPRGGGSAITVADSVSMLTRGIAWLDDGTIVYRDADNRLRRVPDVGGTAEIVWTPPEDADVRPRVPTPLPDARGVLFNYCVGGNCLPQSAWVLDIRSGEARELVPDAAQAWYASTGHVVFVRPDGGVFAAPFDLGSLALTGPAVPVLEGVQVPGGSWPDMALSPSGTLLMIAGPAGGTGGTVSEAVWVSRDGTVAEVDPDWEFSLAANSGWSLSPDGRRLAITLWGSEGNDIWIKELDRGPLSRLTADPANDIRPRWTADGASVSFLTARAANNDLYLRRADGTLPAELFHDLDEVIWEAEWSRDGAWLVIRVGGITGERDIWAQRLDADSVPRRLLASDFDENAVTLSPDGRWLAYESTESGEDEVYVRPFPDITAGKWTVSLDGGTRPLWSHSGRELFYVAGDQPRMMAAQIQTVPTFAVTERRTLFPVDQFLLPTNYTPYDVAADDQRFLMVRPVGSGEDGSGTALILVENWFEELKAKVGR